MKWSACLALLAAAVSASPVQRDEQAGLSVYKLRVAAQEGSPLQDTYLSIDVDGNLGIFDAAPADQASRVYALPVTDAAGARTDKVSLHTYPIGIVDHTLALVGNGGLLQLRDVLNPNTFNSTHPEAGQVDWESFTLSSQASPAATEKVLSYTSMKGSWMAMQRGTGQFYAMWYNPENFITGVYQPIDIVFEETSS